MSDRVATQGASWRQREIIEHLKGGFTIDFDGSKSIEDARVVAGLIHRRWPEVSHHLIELENTARWLARLSAELDKCESAAQVDALHDDVRVDRENQVAEFLCNTHPVGIA